MQTKRPFHIMPLDAETIRAEHSGKHVSQWVDLYLRSFGTEGWWQRADLAWGRLRLAWGLGFLMGKEGTIALIAAFEDSESFVGQVLGYPVTKERMTDIAGSDSVVRALDWDVWFWIDLVGVDPDYRGQGIGKELMGEIISRAEKSGYQKIILRAHPEAVSAVKMYKAMGFVDTGIKGSKMPESTFFTRG